MKSLKYSLILLTIVSVVADTMLLPFYSQFFAQTFDMHSAQHVGYYLAASCFTVMLAFPIWAKVAKKVNELHLWVYTQLIAGALGLACYYSQSLVQFWLLSQLMLVFKASYLLIYPFVIRLEEKHKHMSMVSLFSVLMHFGAIGGALLGGIILQFFTPRDVYLVMPISDVIQVLVCVFIISMLKVPFRAVSDNNDISDKPSRAHKKFVLNIGLVSMLFYFSVFLIRPFFSRYWESISHLNNEIVSGFLYSIPGWVALVGLWINHRANSNSSHRQSILAALFIGIAGIMLQGTQQEWWVFIGRIIFGWGLFQATVRLEVFLFSQSSPAHYASDFSRVYFFQNIGLIAASFTVGYIVDSHSLVAPFYLAMAGLIVTAGYFSFAFKNNAQSSISHMQEAQ
ncbi:hypothetical protein L4C34_09715 [Vibrio profundum]|uniref:MFS transporter n=1 Tax=Vibrio profundum TaxID=2910247 RepID=UPI003D0E8B8B